MSDFIAPPATPATPYREGLRVTWLSFLVNIVLAAAKTGVGYGAQSQALIADGLHSLADLSTDVATLLGLKIAAKPVDEDHPYGHHKFASFACLLIAVVVLGFCVLLIWESAHNLLEHADLMPGLAALWVALGAMVIKETFYQYASRQAQRLKSRVLAANALDHRADALASLLAIVAIGAARLGGPSWAFLDKAVGLALGGYLAVLGGKIFWQASADLLDTAPGEEIINDLREHILSVPGAVAYHNFRARRVGEMYEVDFHLQVDPGLTVEQGHAIAHRVKDSILAKHPQVVDLLIHLEPASAPHVRPEGVHDAR